MNEWSKVRKGIISCTEKLAKEFCKRRMNGTKLVCVSPLHKGDEIIVYMILHSPVLAWDDLDKGEVTRTMALTEKYADIQIFEESNGRDLVVRATYCGDSSNKINKKKSVSNKELKDALWAMREMYNCLVGFYSEQGEGFASSMVKDENKMLNKAEDGIKYLENLVKKGEVK